MYTYEMVGVADQNSRTYKSIYGTYNKEDGFKVADEWKEFLVSDDCEESIYNIETLIHNLFHDDVWQIVKEEPRKMTLAEIEKELGYRVQIADPEIDKAADKKKELSEKRKKEIDDEIKWWRDYLGITLDPQKYY